MAIYLSLKQALCALAIGESVNKSLDVCVCACVYVSEGTSEEKKKNQGHCHHLAFPYSKCRRSTFNLFCDLPLLFKETQYGPGFWSYCTAWLRQCLVPPHGMNGPHKYGTCNGIHSPTLYTMPRRRPGVNILLSPNLIKCMSANTILYPHTCFKLLQDSPFSILQVLNLSGYTSMPDARAWFGPFWYACALRKDCFMLYLCYSGNI